MPVQRRRSTKTFTSKERIEGGFGSLKNFVKVKPQRGRRRKRRAEAEQLASGATDEADISPARDTRKRNKASRRDTPKASGTRKGPPTPDASTCDRAPAHIAGGRRVIVKRTRTNWSNNTLLEAAVEEWDAKGRSTKDTQGRPLSIAKFAGSKGINPSTLYKYGRKEKSKRHKIGKQVGRMPVVSGENTSFLGDVVVRCDRANNGLTRQEAISTLQELEPDLSRKQATNFFNRTFFQKNKGKVKKNLVKAQKTTTKRSQITVAQQ